MHEQLRGHRAQRPSPEACLGPPRPSYEETENLFKRVKVSKELCELRNMINVGYLITRMAIERKESRGLHYTIDYPVHAYDKK